MKKIAKNALVVISLLLSAGLGYAADIKGPWTAPKVSATDAKVNVTTKATDAKNSAKATLIDINSATEAELKAVPGIGAAYAAKIIAGRPYANKTQLKSRKILPGTVYEQVKEMIIAKLSKK